jgi:RHS repeat-associated protein
MINRGKLYFLFAAVTMLLCIRGASAQTYYWSFGFPGSPGCVAVPFPANWAVCSTAQAACASIAGVEFNSKYYVSPSVQSTAQGSHSETAYCNYFYGPWNQWTGIGLSTVCPPGLLSDYNAPPGCSPSPQPDKRLGGTCAAQVNQVLDPSCGARGADATVKDDGSTTVGEPIEVGSGNVFYQTTDYRTAGQNRLGFMRFYNSRGFTDGTLGSHWRSNYDRYIYISSVAAIVERADGQKLTFTLSGGVWTADTDVDYTLSLSGSTWTLIGPDDTVETYTTNSSGAKALLNLIRLRNGYTQTMAYNPLTQLASVTDSYSRTLTFSYSTNNTLASIVTPDNTTISYSYAANGSGINLTSVTWPTSPLSTVTYGYANSLVPNALTSVTDESGKVYATWTYDAYGRGLTSQLGGIADLTTITYNDTTGSRTVTNALGVTDTYTFTTLQNAPKLTQISRTATATTAAATESMVYDSDGYLASLIDWNGNETTYVRNAHGLPTNVTEASGTPVARTTTVKYDSKFVHLPDSIATPELTISYTYDANGNELSRTLTDTTTTTVPYSTGGQTHVAKKTWSNFLLASVTTPNGNTTQFGYDASGALISVTDALNHVTRIVVHSGSGLPETTVDPNGVSTVSAYDQRQRLTSSTVATSAGTLTTTFTYYLNGDVTTTLPDGSFLTSLHDTAHRVIGYADNYDDQADKTLDALGDSTARTIFSLNGTATFYRTATFDPLGRQLTDTSTTTGKSWTYSYDKLGNSLTTQDPLGHISKRVFDALSRVTTSTDANGGVIRFSYDAHDRPLAVSDPNGNTTSYVYDGVGDLIEQVSPDTGTTVFHYDADGNLTSKTDAAGVVTNYTYDVLDRPHTTTYPADSTLNVTYAYDQTGTGFSFGIGRLTSVTDAAGSLTRTYDERGNLLAEKRTAGSKTLITSYSYDKSGRIASLTYPSGAVSSYTRDAAGRVTQMPFAAANSDQSYSLWSITHLPFGPVNYIHYNNGDNANLAFDRDYRQTTLVYETYQNVPYLQSTYAYDGADNLSSITDKITASNSQTFGYDVLNRLTSASSGLYGSLTWTFDHNGNLTSSTGSGTTATYAVAAGTNRLTSIMSAGNSESFGYTATGNRNSMTVNGANVFTGTYSKANRLASVSGVPLAISANVYDAFGKRFSKSNPGIAPTLYTFDQDGNLIEENANGKVIDYLYMDGVNVANWEPGEKHLYAINFDRLGVPLASRDEYGLTNWSAYILPHGGMNQTVTTGQFTGPVTQNLRYPGQYYDGETGYHYNLNRDYDPSFGVYIEADPIGLAGGLNPYLYARGNPGLFIDKSGLDALDAIADEAQDKAVEASVSELLGAIGVPERHRESVAKVCIVAYETLEDVKSRTWMNFAFTLAQKFGGDWIKKTVANSPPVQQAEHSLMQEINSWSQSTSNAVQNWLNGLSWNPFANFNKAIDNALSR